MPDDIEDGEFIPTRQSLLERLRRWDDQEGWQQFFDTYWKLIYRTARKAGLAERESEEVVQETIISVAKQMPGFRYRPAEEGGSFKQWLLRLTVWRINDQLRKKYRVERHLQPLSDDSGIDVSEIPDPLADKLDELWNREWELNLMNAAMERVKSRVEPRDFQVFQLSAIKGWSGLKVSRNMKVSLAQVYTIRHRVTKELKGALVQVSNSAR